MVSITTNDAVFYKRQEIWFYNNEKIKAGDNDMYYCSLVKPNFTANEIIETNTNIIALSNSDNELYADVDKDFKYEIRRAEREGFKYDFFDSPSDEIFDDYHKSHLRFEESKGWKPGSNRKRLSKFIDKETLIISIVSIDMINITYHSYIIDKFKMTVLLYSHHNTNYQNSQKRGYANKFHHWMDILYFKKLGYQVYDFGGLDFVNTPNIAEFKKKFGGKPVKRYSFQSASRKYLLMKKIIG